MKELSEYIIESVFDLNMDNLDRCYIAYADCDAFYLDYDEKRIVNEIEIYIQKTIDENEYEKKKEKDKNYQNRIEKIKNPSSKFLKAIIAPFKLMYKIFGKSWQEWCEKTNRNLSIKHKKQYGPYVHIQKLKKDYLNSPDSKLERLFFTDMIQEFERLIQSEQTAKMEVDNKEHTVYIKFEERFDGIQPYFVYKLSI